MDKLIPVWDHVRDVFLFWAVWKVLDLIWLHSKSDDYVVALKAWATSKWPRIRRLVKWLATSVVI